jgi:hypothetical protein
VKDLVGGGAVLRETRLVGVIEVKGVEESEEAGVKDFFQGFPDAGEKGDRSEVIRGGDHGFLLYGEEFSGAPLGGYMPAREGCVVEEV